MAIKYSKYLLDRNNSSNLNNDCLLSNEEFSIGKIVVRDEKNGFAMINNIRDLLGIIRSAKPLNLHEVVLGDTPRKLIFDIDYVIPNINATDKTSAINYVNNILSVFISKVEKNIKIINQRYLLGADNTIINRLEYLIVNCLLNSLETVYDNLTCKKRKYDDQDFSDVLSHLTTSHGFEFYNESEDYSNCKYKFSIHVLFPIIIANYIENRELAECVINNLPLELQKIMDRGIYKKTMMIRMVNSSKSGSTRVKTPTENITGLTDVGNLNFSNHIITNLDFETDYIWPGSVLRTVKRKRILRNTNESIKNVNRSYLDNLSINLNSENSTDTQLTEEEKELILNNTTNMRISTYHGSIRLQRIGSGHCKICDKVHETDNGYVTKNKFGLFIGCYRSIQYNNRNKLLCLLSYESDSTDLLVEACLHNIDNNTDAVTNTVLDTKNKIIKINEKYLSETVYSENITKDNDILFIQSGTGSGKSYALKQYLSSLCHEKPDIRILMISYRCSLANEQYSNYKDLGFKHYLIDKKELGSNRLIIQVESLHKLQKSNFKPYDLLILDEINKTVEQLNSGLTKNPHGNKAILYTIMKTKNIIGMDAFLNENSIRCVAQFRGMIMNRHADVRDLDFRLVQNDYKHKTARKYFGIKKEPDFIHKLIEQAKDNKVFLAVNSRTYAEKAYNILSNIYKNKIIKLFHGNSDKKTKNQLFNINENWKVDILIYTSVIEAGNSFDIEWFDVGFMYFTNNSTNHLGCLQMADRVRSIKSNTCYFHIRNVKYYNYSLTELEERMKVASYAAQFDIHNSWVLFSKYADTDSKQNISSNNREYKIDYIRKDEAYYTYMRTIAYNEYSKANFKKLLYSCWLSTGITIEEYSDESKNNYQQLQLLIRDTKQKMAETKISNIVDAKIDNVVLCDNVEVDEATQTKLLLMGTFDIPEQKVTAQFIKKYNKPVFIRGYKTRMKIKELGGIDNYKQRLLNKFKESNSEYTPILKIHQKSKYIDKILALDVLGLITDNKSYDSKITVEKSELQRRVQLIIDKFKTMNYPFKYKTRLLSCKPNYQLRIVNEIIATVIDVKISRIPGSRNSKTENYCISISGFVS